MQSFKRFGVSLLVIAGLSYLGMTASSQAQGGKKPEQKKEQPPTPKYVDWSDKKVAFEMRGKEWRTVFEWLSDQTGMPYASPYPAPGGTFTFINPTVSGKPREYTLAEAFDIINEILQGSTKHTLIRRDVTLTMLPADAEFPEYYFPKVDAKDLNTRGKTEIVRTVVTVTNQDVDLVAGQVKKLLGDFGHVIPLPETNQLIMRGTVQSLILARDLLLDNTDKDIHAHVHTHKCIYMRASAAAVILTQNLGQAQSIDIIRTTPKDNTVSADGGPGGGGFGGFGKGPKDGGFGGGGGARQRVIKPHTVTFDRPTNTVIISGPADKISQAKAVLAKIDVSRFEGDKGILHGAPELQNHDLPGGGAETTAKLLTEVAFKDDPSIRIQPSGPSRLLVYADPQTHWDLAKIIKREFQPTTLRSELIVLYRLDPLTFAESVKTMLKDGPYIEADRDNNAIRVRGTEEQIKDVKTIIKAFDDTPFTSNEGNPVRTINLDKGSGATVAEALYILLSKMRPEAKIELIVPGNSDPVDFRKKEDKKPEEKKIEEKKTEENKTSRLTPDKLRELIYVNDPRTAASAQEGKKEQKQPAKKGPSIAITGFGSRIMITGDDPVLLDTAQQMIRMLVNTEAGPGDFEVVRLRVANAVEVAKILDEAFNGKQGGPGGGRGPGGGGPGGGGGFQIPGLGGLTQLIPGMGGGQQGGRVETIRVVADPMSNALLVRAKPIDMLTIRRLLDKHIDIVSEDNLVTVRTHVIGPLKDANAADVADLLRQVYASSLTSNRGGGGGGQQSFGGFGGGGFPTGMGGQQRTVDSGGSSRPALTIGVDNHTNSLYISCSTAMADDIKTLVKDIENSSANAKQAIKIIQVPDIDPALVQQAVAAISGQTTPTATRRQDFGAQNAGGGGRFNFGGGQQGFGQQGFGQQGFGQQGFGGFGGAPNILIGGPGFGGGGGGGPGFGGGGPGGGIRTPGGGPGGGGPGIGGGGIRTPGGGGPGGGITRPGGGGPGGKGRISRGPDFFEQRVMDDPSVGVNYLYDPCEEQQLTTVEPVPQHVKEALEKNPSLEDRPVQLAGALQPKDIGSVTVVSAMGPPRVGTWQMSAGSIIITVPKGAVYTGKISGDLITGEARDMEDVNARWKWEVKRASSVSNEWNGTENRPGFGKLTFIFSGAGPSDPVLSPPRLGVQVEVLPQLGLAILRANNQADLEAALAILEQLRQRALDAKVEVRMVPIRFQDVMYVTNQLNQFFGRVAYNPTSTVLIGGGVTAIVPGQGGQGLLPGGVSQSPIPQAASAQAQNMIFLPQPRQSAILVAAPASRMLEVIEKIHMFDTPNSSNADLVPIPLKRASAARVANALNTFYASRFATGENPPALSQVRVAWDDGTNTLFVQGSFQDVNDIRRFVEYIDDPKNNITKADLRVVQLRNAVATDLAIVLQASIANGILSINQQQALGGAGGGVPGGGIPGGGAGGAQQGGLGIQQQFGLMMKDQNIRFIPSNSKEGKPIESSVFEDIRITPYALNNSLIVIAPDATMPLVLALIRDLDVPPNARSEINIFTLKRSDATQMATMLQQLFTGTGALGAAAGGGPGGGVPPGGGAGGAGTQRAPVQITIQSFTPEGAPIIDLRVTVDIRTNSLIVAGSRNDLLTVETIIDKLENSAVPRRINDTVRLRNANALDVANAVNDFYNKVKAAYNIGGQQTQSLQLVREVVVTADPISNSLMISATPEYFEEVLRQVAKLDTMQPQVLISVLVAEVTLNGNEEFGVELGLQNPLMFTRTQLPNGVLTGYSAAGTPPVSTYSFDFPRLLGGAFPLNTSNTNPTAVSAQGVTAIGVGRQSPRTTASGFVFSAANDSVSVLIRALKSQRRIDVLSRPTVMTLDKQAAVITVGQEIPIQEGSNVTATGVVSNNVTRRSLGVILQVTPQITPDGRILMRIIPEVSSIADRAYPLGNGQFSTSLNIQHLETTVSAYDGDTIMLGGMITKSDERLENKIPWLGDLPGIGAAFRFRLEERKKTELVIIMTPHIVRNREEAQAVLAEESRRIDWNLPDIERVHGKGNCTVFQPYYDGGHHGQNSATKPFRIPNALPLTNPGAPTPKTLPASNNVTPPNPGPATPSVQPAMTHVPPSPSVNPVTPVNHVAPASHPSNVPAAVKEPTAPTSSEPSLRPTGRGGLLKNLFVPAPPRQATAEPPIAEKAPMVPAPSLRDQVPAPLPVPGAAERIPVIVPSEAAPMPQMSPLRIEP